MARNYEREAREACRNCQGCRSREFQCYREEAQADLKKVEREELQKKGRPNVRRLELVHRACQYCRYVCRRERPLIVEVFNASA